MSYRPTGQRPPDDGEVVAFDVDGETVAVASVDGQLYAFSDTCTHMQCSLSGGELEGRSIVCPCHLGTFDIATGEVLDGPPPAPVRTWPVRAVDGVLELGT